MNDNTTIAPTSSFKMLCAMAGIGALCGLLIVFTYESTLPRIEQLRAEALNEAIFKVVPGVTNIRAFTYQNNVFSPANGSENNIIYVGYNEKDDFIGVAIVASGQGYADVIKVLYGYSPADQRVVGFYVLESKETPGLGDKIEKDPKFLNNFKAMDVTLTEAKDALINQIKTVKNGTKTNAWEVDGITGATISSRAIGDIIATSTEEWVPIIFKNQDVFKMKLDE